MSVSEKPLKKYQPAVEIELETYCLSTPVPAYLRFNAVELEYEFFQDFEQMKLHLEHLKNALIGSKFSIDCSFEHHRRVKSSSIFLEHFAKEVLPIINTDNSHAFKMRVRDSLYDEFNVEEIIAKITAALPNSSDLSFNFDLELPGSRDGNKWIRDGFKCIYLPVNQISDWLTRKTHQKSGKKDKQNVMKERRFSVSIAVCRIINYAAMSKCVEKVANAVICFLAEFFIE